MGCSESKTEHLSLVVHLRERQDLIRAAANYRYAFAYAHVSYFRSFKGVGDALQKFIDEELITVESSPYSYGYSDSQCGNRDLKEAVAEIRDEFEMAAGYGKEVAVMLEVGKIPYQPSFLKAILSQILYSISSSFSSRDLPSMQSAKLASKTMKLAKTCFHDVGKDKNAKACDLSSTLEKLYFWEKKLYKEVKAFENFIAHYATMSHDERFVFFTRV